jgi:type I restriction enzyme S subunit
VKIWQSVKLEDICRPKQWPTIPKIAMLEEGFPVYGANGIIGYYSEYNHSKPTVLITCRGATCGTINVCKPQSYVTGNAMALDDLDEEKISLEFLVLALKGTDFRKAINGVAQPQITRQSLKHIQIPLPPLEEQKRIAEILDAADALRAKRRESLAKLDDLLQSTFLDMFGDPVTNPKGWEAKNLEDLCLGITDIDHKMPKAVESGIPFVSAKDLADDGSISFEDVKQISEEDFKRLARKGKPQKGDIIYSRIGVKLGKARLVEVDFEFLASYSCCTIKPNTRLMHRHFLCYLLDSPFILRQAHSGVRAIAVPDLGLGKIKAFKIITPPPRPSATLCGDRVLGGGAEGQDEKAPRATGRSLRLPPATGLPRRSLITQPEKTHAHHQHIDREFQGNRQTSGHPNPPHYPPLRSQQRRQKHNPPSPPLPPPRPGEQ